MFNTIITHGKSTVLKKSVFCIVKLQKNEVWNLCFPCCIGSISDVGSL